MSWYNADDLRLLLERTGATDHVVDGATLFCRVIDKGQAPDEFGRGMVATAELTHLVGATFARSARHDAVVDDVAWQVVGVRQKLSGLVVWSLEREVG